jgi:uncharacterized delta-60 repeat protein
MRLLGLAAVPVALTIPVACASIYGISDLPEGAGDAGMSDASHRDAPPDVAHHDAPSTNDAGIDAHPRDTGSPQDAHVVDVADAAVTLEVTPNPAELAAGGMVTLTVTLVTPASSPVNIDVIGLPAGVTASPAALASGASMGTVTLSATASVTAGVTAIGVRAGAALGSTSLVTPGPSASLDTTFNLSGVRNVVPAGGGDGSGPAAIAIQSNGAILVGGNSGGASGSWELVRLNEDGSLDTAFNANVVDTSQGALLPTSGYLAGIAVLPGSGLIAVAGFDSGNMSVAVMLYNPDGSRYQAYGLAGLFEYGPAQVMDQFEVTSVGGVAADPSGDFAVTGDVTHGGASIFLMTFTGAAHSRDLSTFASAAMATGIVYQPNGDLVIGGYSGSGGGQFYLARFTSSLSAVAGFGGDFGPPAGGGNQYLATQNSLALANDSTGELFLVGTDDAFDPAPAVLTMTNAGVAGQAGGYIEPLPHPMNGTGYNGVACGPTPGVAAVITNGYAMAGSMAIVARITAAGALDTTFNGTGYQTTQLATGISYSAVAIDAFGRIIVGGNEGAGFFIFRLWP